jgi:hypothetical protein
LTYNIIFKDGPDLNIDPPDDEPIVINHFDAEQEWTEIQKFGIGLIKLADEQGISRQFQRDLCKYINRNLISKMEPTTVMSKQKKNLFMD